MSHITSRVLSCGALLLVEPSPSVASAALRWLLPVGAASDPIDGDGHAALLSELIFRGAGGLSSRESSDALDRLGVQRSAQVGTHHLRLGATLLGDRLDDALPLLTAIIRQPTLDDDALPPVRELCLQSLDALDDDPQHLAMIRLRQRHFAPPFNRHGYGERDVLESTTMDTLRDAWRSRCTARGTIMAAAGAIDPDRLADHLDALFSDWSGDHDDPVECGPADGGYLHLEQDTAQVHVGLAFAAPREAEEDAIVERLAVHILGGSTSGRLFTEVRQKRSLCYSVGASYRAGRDLGAVTIYAGTTPERAQETLDVCLGELDQWTAGITPEEHHRAVIGLKSNLIMHGESSAARAGAIAADQFRLGHPRRLDDLVRQVDAVSLDRINAYLARRAPDAITAVSLGPAPLNLPTPQPSNH